MPIHIGRCFAEFEECDRVVVVKVFGDGSMKIRGAVKNRQRIRLEGDPPQRDGFEQDYRGVREIELFIYCAPDKLGVLRRHFPSGVGGNSTRRQPQSGTGSSSA
jgi:hypothetical protein